MRRPLRILHLEDDPLDSELAKAALVGDGVDCVLERVATREAFQQALAHRDFELILADYSLPGFDGIAAQELARHAVPDVPFIFLSGSLGEEVAIERLKSGATDYVIKHRLSRLTTVVRRALAEIAEREERRRAEAEVRRLNSELEARVTARTAELAAANAQLARQEAELRQSETFLNLVVENLPNMLFVKDARELRFVRFNAAGETLLGMHRDELLGRNVAEIFAPEVAGRFMAQDREALESGCTVDVAEERIETRSQGTRVLHTKKIPIRDTDGTPLYLLGISEDITERQAAEDVVRQAQTAAERANSAKSEFLSRMSHDLRTPLNAILGFAQLLDLDAHTDDQRDNVRHILKAGRHLLALINEVLDITRIESGHLSLSLEPVAVAEVVQSVIDIVRPLVAQARIDLSVPRAQANCYVVADRQRLVQVLLNLVANAVKYNRPAGAVTVSFEVSAPGRVSIRVRDTGPGIRPEHIARLFEPFERLGAEETAVEGTGLGLAVSKRLTEAMGGTIGVETEVDRGSTFYVELAEAPPTALRHEEDEQALQRGAPTAGVVLYIEDNASNAQLMERILGRRPGVQLVVAARGDRGLAAARSIHPDLVLLDLHLPDMSGEEILQRLWEDPDTRNVPVAVLSADATPSRVARLLASGARAYLTKPLSVAEVLQLVDDTLTSPTPQITCSVGR